MLLVKYISVLQKQWIKPFLQAQIADMSTTDFIADPTWSVFIEQADDDYDNRVLWGALL